MQNAVLLFDFDVLNITQKQQQRLEPLWTVSLFDYCYQKSWKKDNSIPPHTF